MGHVPALRVRIDPPQLEPDERYFQYVRGLINITAPKAAGEGSRAGRGRPQDAWSWRQGFKRALGAEGGGEDRAAC